MLTTRSVVEDKWASGGVVIAPGGWCGCCCWCHCHVSNALSVGTTDDDEL